MSTYNKTVWQDGDIITADKMNNIENGIYSYNEDIMNLQEGKQNVLTFDQTPTAESANPVTSVGIKNAIEAAVDVTAPGIYETASGSIASFADGADDLPMKSAVVSIEPIQEGTGDPSPENVRPISGRAGLSVVRTGINVWNEEWEVGQYDSSSLTLEKTPSNVHIRSKNPIPVKPNTTYYMNSAGKNVHLIVADADENVLYRTVTLNNALFTTPDKGAFVYFNMAAAYGTTYNNDICINLSDPTKNGTYEPYKGNTYSVNWETEAGTVYGGTLDAVSGKLTVLGVKDTVTVVDGRLQSQFFSDAGTGQTVTVLGNNVRISLNRVSQISNMNTQSSRYSVKMANLCPHYFAYNVDTTHWYINNQLYLYLPKVDVGETIESYRTFLQDNPFEVYIQFATPTEIQLTPQEVRTLLGVNNVWSDGGDMAVEYPADTKLYIDQKITEAIAAAMA